MAVRYSNMDLEDSSILGGQQDVYTVGLNYYVNPYLRFMLNYVYADADDVTGQISNPDGSPGRFNDEPSAIAFRVAMDFK